MSLLNDIAADMTARFAHIYAEGTHVAPDPAAVVEIKRVTDDLFKRIPVKVTWTQTDPYETPEQMSDDIDAGHFYVHCNGYVSNIFGRHYQRFRAVHDYYGHYLAKNPFGVIGELRAYGVHCGQFPPECWAMIFNELVLVNSFREHFGHYSPEDKLVLVPEGL